jgi:hypothetical protein
MIAMVSLVFMVFSALVWSTWRKAKRREAEQGEVFAPPGKLRWSDLDPPR